MIVPTFNSSLFHYDNTSNRHTVKVFTKNSIFLKPAEPIIIPLGFSLDFPENNYKIDFAPDWNLIQSGVTCLGNSYDFKETEREISVVLFYLQYNNKNDVFSQVFNKNSYRVKENGCLGTLSILKYD